MSEIPTFTLALPNRLTRRLEQAESRQQLFNLFELAWQTCFNRPALVPDVPLTAEARVVQAYGQRGLRAAVDYPVNWPFGGDAPGVARKGLDAPFRLPEGFGDPLDPELQAATEVLGQALLDEAYHCLGTDATRQIEKLRAATTEDETIECLDWLNNRLRQLMTGPAEIKGYYHPMRLSPYLIGTYPNHNLPPNCLGVSIIAASFLAQAGLDVLHCGIMQRRTYEHALEGASFCEQLPAIVAARFDLSLPAHMCEVLATRGQELERYSATEEAFHASVLTAKPDSPLWVQLDPGWYCQQLDFRSSQQVDIAWSHLQTLKEAAPGLELTLWFPTFSRVIETCQQLLFSGTANMLPSAEEVRELLLNLEDESVPERIKQVAIDPFFANEALSFIWELSEVQRLAEGEGVDSDVLESAFYEAFEHYVLWQDSPAAMLERCRHDPAYLERRIEDIRALPFAMLASVVLHDVHSTPIERRHTMLEVGLPARRIGAAVLNDFATFCDDGIDPAARLAAWPSSHVPVAETIDRPLPSSAQGQLRRRVARSVMKVLHYHRMNATVGPSLKASERLPHVNR